MSMNPRPIETSAALTIGAVEAVSPNKLVALLDLDAPQATALNAGSPVAFPRLNSFVIVPHETGALVGIVSWLGIEHSNYPKRPGLKDFGLVDLPFPTRKMSIVPVGTLERARDGSGTFRLRRGVTVFPSVGDPVTLPSAMQLDSVLRGSKEDQRVRIGRALLANNADVCVDPDKLFGRHLAVLGNTGSGKSCSVAGLIRWSLGAAAAQREATGRAADDASSRFIVLDPNGEYSQAFGDLSGYRRFAVPPVGDDERSLRVPAWLMNSHEWASISYASARVQRPVLVEGLRDLRRDGEGAEPSRLLDFLEAHALLWETSTSPLEHSDAKQRIGMKERLVALREALDDFETPATAAAAVADLDSALADVQASCFADPNVWKSTIPRPGQFAAVAEAIADVRRAVSEASSQDALRYHEDLPRRFAMGDLAPQLDRVVARGSFDDARRHIGGLKLRLQTLANDARLMPVLAPEEEPDLATWLEDFLGTGAGDSVAVIDLSLMPADVVEVVVAVAARMVFEALQRHRLKFGAALPTTLVLEEAHNFVRRVPTGDDYTSPSELCTRGFERIAREGRKFGLGLVLASQRPSELSPTVLAQCNSFLLHRLVNDIDQALVAKLVPDNLSGLLEDLPSLPSRSALLMGWAATVPTLVEMRELPEAQRPKSGDPNYWASWTGAISPIVDWSAVADEWQGRG